MKNKFFKKAKEDLLEIKLLPEERVNILTAILDGEPMAKPEHPFVFWLKHSRLVPAIALVLIVALGTGTSLAAEGAVPGDLLYPVKIKINEPARNIVKLTPEARAHWEEEKINRRLKEAETLATREKLDEGTRSEIEALLDDHVKTFENAIGQVKTVDNEEKIKKAQKELNKTIDDYSDKLEKEDEKQEKTWEAEQQKELRKIEERVKGKKQKIRELAPQSQGERSGGDSNISGQDGSPREEGKSLQNTKEEERRRDARDDTRKEQEAEQELEDSVDDD